MAVSLLSGCKSPVPAVGNLEQVPPRKIAASLKLPSESEPGPVIPGLPQGAVPQGLVLLPEKDRVLTSHYFDDGRPSCIVSIDWKSGKTTGTFQLIEPDGQHHTGHVGGIAADSTHLWIASDAYLYRGNLEDIVRHPDGGEFRTLENFSTEATHEAAFCSVYNEQIWVGEFALNDKYPTHPAHHLMARDGEFRRGWICGYDPDDGFNHPQKILSTPDRTQGMYATDDYIFLSLSYGRRNRSSIEIFRNPLGDKPHRIVQTSKGEDVPLWFLDGNNHIRSIDLPPMSESIAAHDGMLFVLFESGANKFQRFGKKPIDQLIILNPKELSR